MDNRSDNSSNLDSETEKKEIDLTVTGEEVFGHVFACSLWSAYALYICYRLENNSYWDTFSYLPFLFIVGSYVLGKIVSAIYAEETIIETKQLNYYFSVMNEYRKKKDNRDE